MECNLCLSKNTKVIYTPVNSKIDSKINICKDCGLVFSTYDSKKYEESNVVDSNLKFSHLSCEASYSEIRVGKQQMIHYFFDAVGNITFDKPIQKILDIKSARGHFALKALEYFGVKSIDCIEEDSYMTTTYDNNPNINIWRDKYHKLDTNYNYDLIYSCHTLEHYTNPTKVLKWIFSKLNDGGLFYIDVPNNENINHRHNIDEFFYDKHLFYYNENILSSFIESLGFELLYKHSTPQNIGLFFKKTGIKSTYPKYNLYDYNSNLIDQYKENININRSILIQRQEELNNNFPKGECNVIFGSGRPLDAFIQYGNLNIDNFDYLIDDYLSQITDVIYSKRLYNSSILGSLTPDNILLLVKHPSDKLIEFLTKNNPKVNIIYLSKWLTK